MACESFLALIKNSAEILRWDIPIPQERKTDKNAVLKYFVLMFLAIGIVYNTISNTV